jgi:hypothetical protein
MGTELNEALFLKLARDIGVDRATKIIRDMMGKAIIQHYKIRDIKQLDRCEKVQIFMPKEHRQIALDYLNGHTSE